MDCYITAFDVSDWLASLKEIDKTVQCNIGRNINETLLSRCRHVTATTCESIMNNVIIILLLLLFPLLFGRYDYLRVKLYSGTSKQCRDILRGAAIMQEGIKMVSIWCDALPECTMAVFGIYYLVTTLEKLTIS